MCMTMLNYVEDATACGVGYKLFEKRGVELYSPIVVADQPIPWKKDEWTFAHHSGKEGIYVCLDKHSANKIQEKVRRMLGIGFEFPSISTTHKLNEPYKKVRRYPRLVVLNVVWKGLECVGYDGKLGLKTYEPIITVQKCKIISPLTAAAMRFCSPWYVE